MSDLCDLFFQYFDVILDDQPGVIDEATRLRYQVYCIENDFEDASRFDDDREVDEYDRRSVHSVVRHRKLGVTAASVRLVLSDQECPEALFPIEENCAASLKACPSIFRGIPRNAIAEISRFAVSKDFKRRHGEAGNPAGVGPDPDRYLTPDLNRRRVIPHLILGLFAAIVKMSAEHHVTHWYAVMDVSLLRLLTRFGINFMPMGGQVDYHGLRQPCFGSVDEVLAGIWEKRPDIWRLITADGVVWPAPADHAVSAGG
ncbi:MAG: PEP-CTERM/exosortase system-associated acyltransferase [Gammaproteobacteria bacterium]|nr:PEP-CTERM/exosortase system-associated acyltransferase [Gammaproteobacteria bacterium]